MAASTMPSPTNVTLAHTWDDPRSQQVLQSPFEQRRTAESDVVDFTGQSQVCEVPSLRSTSFGPALLMNMSTANTPNRPYPYLERGKFNID